ncbi:hypothetical protein [Streptomyces sp. WELS2]|uniref:hypothetical protein n=1 Tax=Streptomyces sp. WELS2 TaxID=2749435 RepID=UPI001C68F7EA|nr:hypothetical protein [Streptomyces sp. WELS2]
MGSVTAHGESGWSDVPVRRLLPLALTGLLAVTACQSGGGTGADDDARDLNTMESLPLHAYLPDPEAGGAKAVDRAQWILTGKCMLRLGFTSFTAFDVRSVESTYPVRQGTPTGGGRVGDDSPYGVDDPDLAATYGYHGRPGQESAEQPLEWAADQYPALTGRFGTGDSRRAHGHPIPEGGCMGEARRKIYGAEPEPAEIGGVRLTGPYTVAMKLWADAHARARKDAAWKQADRAWAQCMKEQGLHYPDPERASTDLAWFRTDKPSAKERKTAAADARCKLDTGYVKAVHAVETRAQQAAVDKNRKALESREAVHERAVANARKVIAEAS